MYAQPLRDDDPEYLMGDYSGTTAYARSKRVQVELLPVLQQRWAGLDVYARHPGWADTPGVVESLPTFHTVTGPVLRDLHQGVDTTVWLAAVEPAPEGGTLWHDRRQRPVAITRRTRSTPEQVARTWAWVREALGLRPSPARAQPRCTAPHRSAASATAASRAAAASASVRVRSGARKRSAKASDFLPSPTWLPV